MQRHLHSTLRGTRRDSSKSRAGRFPAPAFLLALLLAAVPAALSADAYEPAPAIELERLGEPTIEKANNYSENTRVRIRVLYPAGHPRAGRLVTGVDEPIRIEEWYTQVYDGRHGATRLPLEVRAPAGEVEIVLKSVARFAHFDMRNMPVPQIVARLGSQESLLQVPQWVDADGNDKTDWLEQRVDDLLARMRSAAQPEVAQAAAALVQWEQSFKRDCGGFDPQHPGVITVSPACVDWDDEESHRVNRNRELTATVLHELRHAWAWSSSVRNARGRRLAKTAAVRIEPVGCPNGCPGPVWLADQRYRAEETDAEAFADRYKHLFP